MSEYFILWAIGQDRPGIVHEVTKTLFSLNCNLEDSSMMRLGSEFGIFLIFSSKNKNLKKQFLAHLPRLRKNLNVTIDIKPISSHSAKFKPAGPNPYIVSVHGYDKPGIVYHVTSCLSKYGFNITDLSTHRVQNKSHPGYILLLEGDLLKPKNFTPLEKALRSLQKNRKFKATIRPIKSHIL